MTDKLRKVKQYCKLLDEARIKNLTDVSEITTCPCGYKTSNTPPALSEFVPFRNGEFWGSGNDSHAWFHFRVESACETLYLRACTDRKGRDADNPQFIAYVNGKMRQGMDTNHTELFLGKGSFDIYLYAYTGQLVPRTQFFAATYELDQNIDTLYYDLLYPLEMLDYLHAESGEYANILRYLYNAVSMLDLLDPKELSASAKTAHDYLAKEFYGSYCGKQNATVRGIGHTHIDCAWLWTLEQTKEKVQRSFATVLELMKRYPEYKFMSSQALLYLYLKEEAPELYKEVKQRVKEGRWEVEGSMWVEADCNLSSGESLVRQVLYGKEFFKKEFGVDNHVLWLPDVFGYSAALPQILRKSGVDWFVTSKISWNDTNQMPYDTFLWRGIDGTEINSYFLTAQNDNGGDSVKHTTYVGKTNAQMISGTYKRYHQKDLNQKVLLTFGFGDGGGGPTLGHLEHLRRGAYGIPGSPNTEIGFAGEFLDDLAKKIGGNPLLPVWQGELYLEFHRGTYTTMANNKKNNRKCEFLLENTEALSVMNQALLGAKYPKEALAAAWHTTLTNQFHDIIPGSSIKEVYDRSEKDYAEVYASAGALESDAMKAIASHVAKEAGYVLFNPHSYESAGVVALEGKTALTAKKMPSKGYAATKDFVTENHVAFDGKALETELYRVIFDDAWQIVSIYDKKNAREVLKAGQAANELRAYADYPDSYDAWEWQIYSNDQYETITSVASCKFVQDGARAGLSIERPYRDSKITQIIWFYDALPTIEFETTVDWHEKHKMLKSAFPVDINSDKATFEIQFGTIERPTHFNTPWDQARFETCAHKYADLSDGGYGVSILNDCKYGHDIHDGVIQLSLLRSPTYPNPEADQGLHHFTYALYPHAGRLTDADTAKYAYYLNKPMVALKASGAKTDLPTEFSLVSLDHENLICETVKASEDGKGTILRVYESQNRKTPAKITLGIPAKKVYLCNLLEEKEREIPVKNGCFAYDFSGFEIATFRVEN